MPEWARGHAYGVRVCWRHEELDVKTLAAMPAKASFRASLSQGFARAGPSGAVSAPST